MIGMTCAKCPYKKECDDWPDDISCAEFLKIMKDNPPKEETSAEGGNMTEVKIVMDDYGLLYAIFSDGSKRAIRADIFGNPYYGIVRVAEEPKEE